MKRHTDMTTQKVKQLLQRFMDGTTTLEEEALLAEYFRTHEAAGGWAEYKEMFALFDNGKVKPSIKQEKRSRWWKYAGIAAAISLLISLGFFLPCSNQPEQPKLIAKADTAKTVPLTEPKQAEPKQTEKNDTVNKVKEIYKTARPPKYYMANLEEKEEEKPAEKPQPAQEEATAFNHAETEALPEPETFENPYYTGLLPQKINYEELKREIQQHGQRLMNEIDLAINEEEEEEMY